VSGYLNGLFVMLAAFAFVWGLFASLRAMIHDKPLGLPALVLSASALRLAAEIFAKLT
jgi:hypothetical protein